MYAGRFAPSPTGPLHVGSLLAALTGWLDARAANGRWHVRMEDLDPPREQPGAADSILRTLEALGLYWDGAVLFQSRRAERYRNALEQLRARTYWCGCSRREIADSSLALASDGAHVYPGTCREGLAPGKAPRALRVETEAVDIAFEDRLQGVQRQALAVAVGDFVLYRADGQFAYQLAVVVDDAEQGITDVVRGADLLDSTARQIYLQRLLGLAEPRYLHVPVVINRAGEKLSKQTGAPPIDVSSRSATLALALRLLGQAETDDLQAAVRNWRPEAIPRCRTIALP